MVWKRILAQLRGSQSRVAKKYRQRLLRLERMERREVLASDIGAIAGVAFIDQANDGLSVDDPPVLVDGGGNLVTPGTPGAQGVQVQLFEDTNGNQAYDDGIDLLIGTDFTDLDGNYRFDNLSPGDYFLLQQDVPELRTPSAQLVVVTNDGGEQTALIDDYSLTTQSVTATSNGSNNDSASASEAIGNARDILVTNTADTGQITVFVDDSSDTLSVGSLGDAVGTALIQYDGPDGTTALDPIGLGGVSLAGGNVGEPAEVNSGLIVQARAENAGDMLFITIHSDGGNSSTASLELPEDQTVFIERFVRFTEFTVASGTGADFNNVGAIEASIGLSPNNDAFVSIIEARRPDVVDANLANIQPITLGGELFADLLPEGKNNGFLDPGETGLAGITVDLYKLDNADDVVDPDGSVPLTSTTTGAGGNYSFPGLDPGHYAAVVPASQFQQGAALFGWANSTGNDPPSDPNDNVDGEDKGTTIGSGAVITDTITLESNMQPVDDDDMDPNTNTTLDFGFFSQVDLSILKTVNDGLSQIEAGGEVVFDFVIENQGPLTATGVVVQDTFPDGLTFTGIQNASGSFMTTVDGSVVDVMIGDLDVGATATFQLTADIDANQNTNVTNTAGVNGDQVDTDDTDNTDGAEVEFPTADLRIEKNDLADPVTAGNQLTYEIIVTNDGGDVAQAVSVTDQLPAEVTFVSGDVDGDTSAVTNNGGGEIIAMIGALNADATSTVTIIVAVDADADGPLTNTATVIANPDTDPDLSNNTTTEDTQVERLVDVGVTKSAGGNGVAGGELTYSIEVTNNGPSQARGVSVVDTLVDELAYVDGSFDAGTSGVTIDQNGQELTFTVGLLDPGQTETFTFDVLFSTDAQGTVGNTAEISTLDNDSNSGNDTGFVSVTVEQRVDLVLEKTADVSTAVPGQDEIVYTFTVSHADNSISDATGVTITDTIPAGLEGTEIDAPDADSTDFTDGVITVVYDSIPLGETRTFTLRGDVEEDATGTITNGGEVSSDGTELEPSDNTDSVDVTLDPDFDVILTKAVDDPSPTPTDTVTYTVSLENDGPSTAPNVVLTDDIPTGLTFVSGTLEGQSATSDGTTVTFPSIAIDAGTTVDATLVFTVDATTDGLVTNTASVPDMTADGERDITNNSDSVEIDVVAQVDLEVTNSVSLSDAIEGSELIYVITVTNNGPSPAAGVEVVDVLPDGVEFVSGTGPNGETLNEVNGEVVYDAGLLNSDQQIELTIVAEVATGATGIQTNTATVSSDTDETDPSNNVAAATTSIDSQTSSFSGLVFHDRNNNGIQDSGESGIADVILTMTGTNFLGDSVNFTITTDANGVYLFDDLAEGTYEVTQSQPEGFRDGQTILGSGASAVAADNVFSQIALGRDIDAINFIFTELSLPLSKRNFLASS